MAQIQQIQRFGSEAVSHAVEWLDPLHMSGEFAGGRTSLSGASRDLVPIAGPGAEWQSLPDIARKTLWAATQSSLAASRLLNGQVLTVGLLGSGLVGQLMLAGVVRYVPGVSYVSLYTGDSCCRIVPGVLDQLDLAGVGFARAKRAAEAVRGANLVIACDEIGLPELRVECLSPRCVLINASGLDLPDELVDRVDAIFVDDMWLLNSHRHRRFVRSHLAAAAGSGRRSGSGKPGPRKVRAVGDFHRLSTGLYRPHVDRLVLVELLGDGAVSTASASVGLAEATMPLRMIAND